MPYTAAVPPMLGLNSTSESYAAIGRCIAACALLEGQLQDALFNLGLDRTVYDIFVQRDPGAEKLSKYLIEFARQSDVHKTTISALEHLHLHLSYVTSVRAVIAHLPSHHSGELVTFYAHRVPPKSTKPSTYSYTLAQLSEFEALILRIANLLRQFQVMTPASQLQQVKNLTVQVEKYSLPPAPKERLSKQPRKR